MAKRAGTIVAGVLATMCCVTLWAQQKAGTTQVKNTGKDTAASHAKKRPPKPVVYLGRSNFSGGEILVKDFDSLLKQGITARDDKGNAMKILGFNFNYAERRLFENEEGEMSMQIDFATEFCPGDTITSNISGSIYDRIKGGDTVFIAEILLEKKMGNDVDTVFGKEMKCVIKKAPAPTIK